MHRIRTIQLECTWRRDIVAGDGFIAQTATVRDSINHLPQAIFMTTGAFRVDPKTRFEMPVIQPAGVLQEPDRHQIALP